MMSKIRHFGYLGILITALTLGSCAGTDIPEEVTTPQWPEGYDPEVTLALKVSIDNISGVAGTRSLTRADDDYSYENPTGDLSLYEKINTLRVIIVRPDSTVEYNRMDSLTKGEAVDRFDKLEFKVSTSQGDTTTNGSSPALTRTETKRIYLIANEKSIPSADIRKALKDLKPKSRLSEDTVSRWIISGDWGQGTEYASPMLDNSGETKSFVPMTEFFDVDVKTDLVNPGPNLYQEAHLFVTRNYVKFRFTAHSDTESFRITGIRFENLMQKEYLFPNTTVYSPSKESTLYTGNPTDGRQIISFRTPSTSADENLVRPFVFKPSNFEFTRGSLTPSEYNPPLYFCETNNTEADLDGKPIYKIGVTLQYRDSDGGWSRPVTFDPVTLPNLPNSLPRNTIVKVDMKINERHSLTCTVTLEPYIFINLEPEFGDPQDYVYPRPQ